MLMLGYERIRRRSELCSVCFEGFDYQTQDEERIWLRFSKIDQYGEGKLNLTLKVLAGGIEYWRITMQIESGYSLRKVTKTSSIKPTIRRSSINLRLKFLQRAANLFKTQRSTVTFFGYGTIDLLEAREPMEKITLRGGW